MHNAFKCSYNHVYTLVSFGDIQQYLGVAHLISSPYGTTPQSDRVAQKMAYFGYFPYCG